MKTRSFTVVLGVAFLALATKAAVALAATAQAAPPPVFSVTVDKTNVSLGDRVIANYSARIPPGSSIEIEALVTPAPAADAPPGGGPVLEFEKPLPALLEKGKTAADVVTWRQAVAFTPFTSGAITVPGPRFVFVAADGERTPIRPDAVVITVASRLPAAQKPEALSPKADRPARIPVLGPWFWGSIALAALLLTAAIIWFVRRRRRVQAIAEAAGVPALAPGAELLLALERLTRDADVLGGDPREFYSALTHSVKRYLERRLNEPVLEWTTFETVRRLRERGTEFPRHLGLPELLAGADQVKFGKGSSTREEARRNLDRARQLHDHLEALMQKSEAAASAAGPSAPVPSSATLSAGERS
ncbi:MAG: hypothetical protein ABIT01_16540 [Thermoanaerobaculia bacterium]